MHHLFLSVITIVLAAQNTVEQRFLKDLNYLAGPELECRGNGGKGLDMAADYIQTAYQGLGLEVDRQTYPFVNKIERLNASCVLAGKELIFGKDIETFGSSGDGNFEDAPIVFAGFGLNVSEWNDFSGVDAKGKVAAISRRIPDIGAVKGVARSDLALHSRIRRIASLGALAVLVLEDGPAPARLKREEGPLTQPIPVLSLPIAALEGAKELLESITDKPVTKKLQGMTMDLNVQMRQATAQLPNVTAILPGSDPVLSGEYIVVGAHMDHIGMGERHSRSGAGRLHPGADDNASGTAMLMELARRLKTSPPKRSLLFAHFSGEEEGLLGSAHWIQCPTAPIPSLKFMVNFDMVGRLDADKPVLHVGGLGAAKAMLEQSRSLAPGGLAIGSDLGFAMGGSDHMSFATARIPSYFFFTGIHTEYHTPQDTVDRLNIPGMTRIASYAAKVIQNLADAPELPPFDPSTAQNNERRHSGGRRIAFGTVPDFSEGKDGFRITGTTPGSTAEGLGLKGGDRIVSFGEKPVADIYDFMEALGAFRGGDRVTVKWIRDGQEIQAEATLRER
ncbi:MAG: M28 family peptidase [Holophagales bacterium]|jgi:hypothetical protein|nr:M28 family peptidase [Holophagales bacterium]